MRKFDNAASHLTEDAFEPICRFVGCRMEAGPVGEPTVRPYIERFFGTLTERMSTKVPGTTGRRALDPAGQRAAAEFPLHCWSRCPSSRSSWT